MRTPITLQEFLFTLNQEENVHVLINNYETDDLIVSSWKDCLFNNIEYQEHKNWFVQDFISTLKGLEITIVKSEEELD